MSHALYVGPVGLYFRGHTRRLNDEALAHVIGKEPGKVTIVYNVDNAADPRLLDLPQLYIHKPLPRAKKEQAAWLSEVSAQIVADLKAKPAPQVLVHCDGGHERSAAVVAAVLIRQGVTPAVAIANVRAAHPGALRKSAMMTLVQNFADAHLAARETVHGH